ncbi:hypothetical protein PAMP_006165 [Pampus punctatissimus]
MPLADRYHLAAVRRATAGCMCRDKTGIYDLTKSPTASHEQQTSGDKAQGLLKMCKNSRFTQGLHRISQKCSNSRGLLSISDSYSCISWDLYSKGLNDDIEKEKMGRECDNDEMERMEGE